MSTFRPAFWRWITITALAITAIAALPTTASASTIGFADERCLSPGVVCEPAVQSTASLQHIGWTYLNLNHCPVGMMCPAIFRESMAAWSWNGRAWSQASLSQGWVYVYPYTGSWRWAWTQSTGWVAVSGGRFEIRRY